MNLLRTSFGLAALASLAFFVLGWASPRSVDRSEAFAHSAAQGPVTGLLRAVPASGETRDLAHTGDPMARSVALGHEASVTVEFVGDMGEETFSLVVLSGDGFSALVSRAVPSTRFLELTGLPADSLRFQLISSQGVVDERTVRAQPGEGHGVQLRFPELNPPLERASLGGWIHFPFGGYSQELADRFRVRVFSVVDGKAARKPEVTMLREHFVDDPDVEERFYFTTFPIPVGQKRVELHPLGLYIDCELTSAGGFADLAVPALAVTQILLRDPSGAPVDSSRVNVLGVGSDSVPGAKLMTTPLAQESAIQVISAPGRISIQLGNDHWYPFHMEADVAAGANRLEYELQQASRFEVAVQRDGKPAEFSAAWWMELDLEPLDSNGRYLGKQVMFGQEPGSNRTAFLVSSPGAYRVVLPPVAPGATSTSHEIVLVEPRGSIFHLDPRTVQPVSLETR